MLFLQFDINNELYAINVDQIKEIIPYVKITGILNSPDYISGMINFRGTIIPVVDISFIVSGKKAQVLLSSRIVIVNIKHNNIVHQIGILTEKATEIKKYEDKDFQPIEINSEIIGYIENIKIIDNTMLKILNINRLLQNQLQDIILTPQE